MFVLLPLLLLGLLYFSHRLRYLAYHAGCPDTINCPLINPLNVVSQSPANAINIPYLHVLHKLAAALDVFRYLLWAVQYLMRRAGGTCNLTS